MAQPMLQPQEYWSSTDGRTRRHEARRSPRRPLAIFSHKRTAAAEVALLGLILAVLQIMDGVLTGIGVSQFGVHMEGNFLLKSLMLHMGNLPALVLVKTTAIGVIAVLCVHNWQVPWLKHALRGVIALYLTFAVIPWMVLLSVACFA